ncbi:MAG: YtcA family lipoprotein [Caulobacteraceae bacterium]
MNGARTAPGKRAKRSAAGLGAIVLLSGLEGCDPGAPSLSLVGAYFPAWILCSLIGLAAGIIARIVLSATRLAQVVAYPLLLCMAIGVIAGILAWLAFYRG